METAPELPERLPTLDLHLMAQPDQAVCSDASPVEGCAGAIPLVVEPTSIPPMTRTFEEVVEQFEQLPKLFVELDGSFAWTGGDEANWRLEGMLYDVPGGLQRCEVRGNCDWQGWQTLLRILGYPEQPLIAFLQQQRVFVGVDSLGALWPHHED